MVRVRRDRCNRCNRCDRCSILAIGLLFATLLRNAAVSASEYDRTSTPGASKNLSSSERKETLPGLEGLGNFSATARTGKLRIPLCCPLASRRQDGECVEANGTFRFPPLYDSTSLTLLEQEPTDRDFETVTLDPCIEHYKLDPDNFSDDAFAFLDNGSIYKLQQKTIIPTTRYCFALLDSDVFEVLYCFSESELLVENEENVPTFLSIGMIVSIPFLFATFLVYAILPQLKNTHGRTLRGYVGSLLNAYAMLIVVQITPQKRISDTLCLLFAFVINFSFLASFFWLNVMCFDIWWTFGGFRSLQGSVNQRERKKFLIYSVYAWGCASLLTGVCILVDNLPDIPNYIIRPKLGVGRCWYATEEAKALYFYGPMGITVLCNICLFVSTALKIVRHKKDTAHHLKGADSRRHDDNRQWFNLYLKLFIVMGINWSMEIVSWLCNNEPAFIWYLTDLTNTLQGVIIFLIFVWKNNIKRLLIKRFGCRERNFLSRNSTRSACHSSATSRTCTTSATPFQEKVAHYPNESSYARTTFDNID